MTWYDALIGLVVTTLYLILVLYTDVNPWLLFGAGAGAYLGWILYTDLRSRKSQ